MVGRLLSFSRAQPVAASPPRSPRAASSPPSSALITSSTCWATAFPLCLEQRIAYYVAIPLAAMVLLGLWVGSSRKVMTFALLAIARRWPGTQASAPITPASNGSGGPPRRLLRRDARFLHGRQH